MKKSPVEKPILSLLEGFPWHLGDSLIERDSFYTKLKKRRLLLCAISAIKQVFKDSSCYHFPLDFIQDSKQLVSTCFTSHTNRLEPELRNRFLKGFNLLKSHDIHASFQLSCPKVTLSDIQFTFGPLLAHHCLHSPHSNPSPPYISKRLGFKTHLIPNVEYLWPSDHRKAIQEAENSGLVLDITCHVQSNVDFTLVDKSTDITLLKDSRRGFYATISSPHLLPGGENMYKLNHLGHWELAWEWMIKRLN